MSKTVLKSRHFVALPLTVSVSALLLSACTNSATVPTHTNKPTNVAVTKPKPTQSVPSAKTPTSYSSILDKDSLDELDSLLEATDMKMVEDNYLTIQQKGNLWDRVRAGYRIDQSRYQYNARIEAQKKWFITHQDYLNRLTARASRYLYHTVREAERRNIPTELALLPVIESSYDPNASSNASAVGLWQFIPSTGKIYGLAQNPTYDGRRDIIESTRAAYDFLTALHNQFGSWELALAAYNAGPGRIQRAIDYNASRGLPTDFWSLNLPKETMNYVPRFLAVSQIVANPQSNGVYLPAIANRKHFRTIPVNQGVTLGQVAEIINVPVEELRLLNPGLINLQVDGFTPNRIVVPDSVTNNLDARVKKLQGQGYPSAPVYVSTNQQGFGGKEDIAAFAANAPRQNTSYIAPISNNSTVSQDQSYQTSQINQELAASNSLPTTSAAVTANNTIIQEPPLTQEERDFIAEQIRTEAPDVKEVISPVDGNIKLSAIQTQQSILEARNQEKRLSFNQPANRNNSAYNAPLSVPAEQGTYKVQPGDSLYSIAQKMNLNWRDLAEWNNLNPSASLLIGSTLYLYNNGSVPSYGNHQQPSRPSQATNNYPAQNRQVKRPDSYIVQPGDTLIGTASKFGLSVSELASYNNLDTNAQLSIKQKLWLVPGKVKPVARPSNTSATSGRAQSIKTQNYIVKPGDTLIGLSKQFNLPIEQLAQMNGIATNEILFIGQSLTIPANIKVSNTNSSTNQPKPSSKATYTEYKVKSGDTLIGIANDLGVTTQEIAEINDFGTNARLQAGVVIKLPASKNQIERKLNKQPIRYRVQAGDTLIGLANHYDVSVSELAAANNLTTNANLIRGRIITIPVAGQVNTSGNAKTSTAQTTETKSVSGNSIKNTEDYRVQAGDTLIGLASQYGVSVEDLAATNKLASNARLRRGQVLKVPKLTVTYQVKPGDNLISLAKKYGISTKELADMNGISPNTMLKRGQKLTVPNR